MRIAGGREVYVAGRAPAHLIRSTVVIRRCHRPAVLSRNASHCGGRRWRCWNATDYPVSDAAPTGEGYVDANCSRERLGATQAACQCAGILGPPRRLFSQLRHRWDRRRRADGL